MLFFAVMMSLQRHDVLHSSCVTRVSSCVSWVKSRNHHRNLVRIPDHLFSSPGWWLPFSGIKGKDDEHSWALLDSVTFTGHLQFKARSSSRETHENSPFSLNLFLLLRPLDSFSLNIVSSLDSISVPWVLPFKVIEHLSVPNVKM